MLVELNISNFAIIDDLHIEFTHGLNVLTGETGSGKSIIIDALDLLLGARANRNYIKTGEERALIQGVFEVDESISKWLEKEYGVWKEELLIITRELYSKKPSITRLNGQVVPLQQLVLLMEQIIDVFAQNEGQSIVSIKKQRELIDSFGNEEYTKILRELKKEFKLILELRNEIEDGKLDESSRMREIDLLNFQIDEIDSANLSENDEEPLQNEYRQIKNHSIIMEGLQRAIFNLEGDYPEVGGLENIEESISSLNSISQYSEKITELLSNLEGIKYELNDILLEMKSFIELEVIDQEQLFHIESRIDTVNELKRKYGNSIDKIHEFLEMSKERLHFLDNYQVEIEQRKQKLSSLINSAMEKAEKISCYRKNIGKNIENSMSKILRELNIPDADFEVRFFRKDLSYDGIDMIEFYISTNLGEVKKPLAKIASGGEMSRIMLGFKSIIANQDKISTLVFDEIDTGISGFTAQVVGDKIKELSLSRQVLVISHLPQIVSLADSHYYIEKKQINNRVTSSIKKLNREGHVQELARLISGKEITDKTLEISKEMIGTNYQ